jgi:hypothetical protein
MIPRTAGLKKDLAFNPGGFKEVVDAKTSLILGWVYSKWVKKITL